MTLTIILCYLSKFKLMKDNKVEGIKYHLDKFLNNIFDWKSRLKKKSSSELLQLYSEKERLNIEPQIFAGNVLFERGYDALELRKIKQELIESIEEAFEKRYHTNPDRTRFEKIFSILFYYLILPEFLILIISIPTLKSLNKSDLFYYNEIVFILALPVLLTIFQFFRMDKHFLSIDKYVEEERKKKEELLERIKVELKF
jgi:hypothetical protein